MFSASKSGSVAVAKDPYFPNVSLLLHGDGTNGAQNNTFLDSSTNNFTITRNGNTTQGSFSPYGSNWGNYFSGSSQYMTAPSTAGSLGSGDFTVECWIYCTATSVWSTICSNYSSAGSTAFAIFSSPGTDNKIGMYVGNSIVEANSTITLNAWTHVAAVRSSGVSKLYINGVAQTATVSYSGSSSGDGIARIGCAGDNPTGTNYTGYISNMRWVVGTAVYTTNFTPSTTPLTAITNTSLLTCQSNRFIDNSSNNFALTVTGTPSVQRFSPFAPTSAYSTSVIGGSGYFDGTGDYLSCGSQTAYAFGTGNFTVEAWIYPTATTGTYQSIIDSRSSDGSAAGWNLGFAPNYVFVYNAGFVLSSSAGSVPYNTWTHVAFVRNGSTIALYINGISSASTSTASNFTDSAVSIGANPFASSQTFLGYIANARLVKGTAVYTANFTPPTAPLTAITNTSLLCNMTNGAIYDNAEMNDLETVGNAQISTAVKKYGTGSLYFDGTGDWLFTANRPNLTFAGSFTIEFWINFSSVPANFIGLMAGTSANTQLFITTKSNGTGLRFGLTGVVEYAAGSKTWSTGVWYHIALVRNGTDVKFYVDGVNISDATYTNSTTYSGGMYFGATETGTVPLTGYIDDLRITKGIARYTANFTPPTAAFPNQ